MFNNFIYFIAYCIYVLVAYTLLFFEHLHFSKTPDLFTLCWHTCKANLYH